MKKIIYSTYFLLFMMITLLSGCKRFGDFGDINTNPNGSSTVETSSFIASIEARLGSRTFGTNDAASETTGGYFCQYFSQPTYPVESRYSAPQVNMVGIYAGVLQDCKVIIDRNTDPATLALASTSGAASSQIAIARILKTYIFWGLTDKFGDIPYSQALKGVNFLTPKYDSQKSIYEDMISELKQASAQFDVNGLTVKGDLIYNGNIAKWKKFANSLRLLMALRLSKQYPTAGQYAAIEFQSALNDPAGIISSNSDNFALDYKGGSVALNNPWSSTGNSADLGESLTMTTALTGFGDPRINAFGTNSVGVPYGSDQPASTSISYAKILSAPFKATTGPVVFISAAAVMLAKAEGIERGWVSGLTSADAEVAYNAGITASFAQWGQTLPANFLTTGPANYASGIGGGVIGGATVLGSNANTPNKLARINVQQWIAFYPISVQGWSNWRRTSYPDLKPTIKASNTSLQIPRRYIYGTSEYSLNFAQVTSAAAAIGGDNQDTRVWWDKQ